MSRLPRKMRNLSWQLAYSYLLVTLVAALIVQIAVTLGPVLQELEQSQTTPDQVLLKQSSLPFAQYLAQTTPDPNALRYWTAIPLFDSLHQQYQQTRLVSVLDVHGQVLASTACGSMLVLTSSSQTCFTAAKEQAQSVFAQPYVQTAIRTALQSENQATESVSLPDGSLLLSPVLAGKIRVAGILAVQFHGAPISANSANGLHIFLSVFWNHMQLEGLAFLFLASVLGTLMGLLVSRNLTRRLREIALVAAIWSRGQFQVAIQDHSPDELGKLAQDLNQMALQVQNVLKIRQQFTLLEERQRVARDLHDSVKQHTFALTLLIGAGKKYLEKDTVQARLYLTEAEELADQARQELTTIIQELRPLALMEKGLVIALQEYIDQWSRHAGIVSETSVQDIPTMFLVQEEQLFRVLQEALANVVRHSKASKVSVRLFQEKDEACLIVADNGQGFNVALAVDKGLGLATMRERLQIYQGTVRISSTHGGTIVEARMPRRRQIPGRETF